ncbi:MAG: hypothetical protein IGS48_22345, partial [Oscillatoriales cyanobacterium C42_A2020_001]|nr:hypothetical protein [Leptolyngbyaceae cyanobacterium C42_A2020_001]
LPPTSTPPVVREIPPFKPELFSLDDSTEKLPPFRLEQLDNLFVDATSGTGAPLPGTVPDKQSLDAAFESLLGTPPSSALEGNMPPAASRQKKKEVSQTPSLNNTNANLQPDSWYLGIDMGATSLSAVLFNAQTRQQYAIYWIDSRHPTPEPFYNLSLASDGLATALNGIAAAVTPETSDSGQPGQVPQSAGFSLLHRFKPYLNVTIPFLSPQTQRWEPQIRQSETQSVPLMQIQQGLVTLLSTLNPASSLPIHGQADGFSADLFQTTIARLTGVILNQPVGSSDAYRFNLREAVLAAGLVADPARIFFLEEAIAALLPELPAATNAASTGGILVVSAGTSSTELVLANLAGSTQLVLRSNIYLRRVPYAGNALDQDIICQLLLPTAKGWESLKLDTLNLPLPGEPDLEARYRLQQRLESVPLGQQLLNAVRQMKPRLCQQDMSFDWEGNHWELRHQDLKSWVLAPYLQQLNREVNSLLNQVGQVTDAIHKVICTGGTSEVGAIALWLQRKFPQATLIRDDALADSTKTNRYQRIAAGLARLPLFPDVLDPIRHQYNEYFLLRTILKTLPVQTGLISAAHLQALLEQQNIPANACQPFINNLLEGQLPPGLGVTKASAMLLASESLHSADYQELAAAPLFSRQGNQVYRVSRQQRDRLWNHLQIILANTHQTLENPLAIALQSAPINQ